MKNKITYKSAGVDIDIANKTKDKFKKFVSKKNKVVLNNLGAFASIIDIDMRKYKDPVFVMKTEEPGSKQKLAFRYDYIESICYDMINHLINDIAVIGAKPVAVQDAIICGKLEGSKVVRIVKSLTKACEKQECFLVGGETSEQPKVLHKGDYILTSSIFGAAERAQVIDGSKIKIGDTIIAIGSSGPHTNGYSLIRALIEKRHGIVNYKVYKNKTFLDLVMEPHVCYLKVIQDILKFSGINGLAHITGGGIKENLNRILPSTMNAVIQLEEIRVLPIFEFIKKISGINQKEFLRTFNVGVGLIVVCDNEVTQKVIAQIKKNGHNSYCIGQVVKGHKEVLFKGNLR